MDCNHKKGNSMAITVLIKIIEMLVILLCGVIVYKAGLIDAHSVTRMSNLLLLLVSPILIFQSYQMDFDRELFRGLLWSLAASCITFAVTIVLTEILFHKKNAHTAVEKAACVYSNCGFFGIPLINSLLGAEGVFYITAFNTIFNILLWTHGVMIMDRSQSGLSVASLKKLVHPGIISVLIGLACFLLQIRLPSILSEPLDMIADMTTPLAMIIAGANLAQSNLWKSLRNGRTYLMCALKLLVFPMVSLVILWLLPLSFTVSFSLFIAIASPIATTTVMFAARYDQDAPYASELLVTSTVFSAVTIPLLSILAERLLGA